ncbi:MAG: DNA repair protein RecO [bacterium]|nr:DNA repair protein RecO [Gammaproteobacteria bacterium]HIL99081.1 DNA repair protein RecO [Pseudomonadales bacterium]
MTTFSRDAELTPAYILHTRKYRDTSLLADFITEKEGRVTAVIRGARGGKKKTGVVQPFTPLLVSYIGRGDLKTVTKLDAGNFDPLSGESLLVGFYVNELLVRLLGKFEPVPVLFHAYQALLLDLVSAGVSAPSLRIFELTLLRQLGYGITFGIDAMSGEPVKPGCYYRYVPDEGFHELVHDTENASYKGENLLAISNGDLSIPEVDSCAKKIIQVSFAVLLGGKPLKSRELFEMYHSGTKQKN